MTWFRAMARHHRRRALGGVVALVLCARVRTGACPERARNVSWRRWAYSRDLGRRVSRPIGWWRQSIVAALPGRRHPFCGGTRGRADARPGACPYGRAAGRPDTGLRDRTASGSGTRRRDRAADGSGTCRARWQGGRSGMGRRASRRRALPHPFGRATATALGSFQGGANERRRTAGPRRKPQVGSVPEGIAPGPRGLLAGRRGTVRAPRRPARRIGGRGICRLSWNQMCAEDSTQ